MKLFLFSLFTVLSINAVSAQSSIEGVWEAIDDKDGQPSSHIEISSLNGEIKAKIIKIFDVADDVLCELCTGDKKNQPVVGMEIIYDMKKRGDTWQGGRILDPEVGKDYKCKITMENDNILNVRGYIGVPAFGRTQTWNRVK